MSVRLSRNAFQMFEPEERFITAPFVVRAPKMCRICDVEDLKEDRYQSRGYYSKWISSSFVLCPPPPGFYMRCEMTRHAILSPWCQRFSAQFRSSAFPRKSRVRRCSMLWCECAMRGLTVPKVKVLNDIIRMHNLRRRREARRFSQFRNCIMGGRTLDEHEQLSCRPRRST